MPSAAPRFLHRFERFPLDPGLALFVDLRALVPQPLGGFVLPAEIEVALVAVRAKRAVVDGGTDSTAGLGVMPAIAESAGARMRDDVGERLVETLVAVPELQLPHAGRVDQQAAARAQEHLPMHARVAAARIALAHLAGVEHVRPDEAIHDRGLPGARRPEERHRRSG